MTYYCVSISSKWLIYSGNCRRDHWERSDIDGKGIFFFIGYHLQMRYSLDIAHVDEVIIIYEVWNANKITRYVLP